MEEPSPTKPHQTEIPYAPHVDDGVATDVGAWRVGLCGGCCDDCCSCCVPTFVPCVGLSEAASAITDRSTATKLTFFFSILVLVNYIVGTIVFIKRLDTKTSYDYHYYAGMYYGYEDTTKKIPVFLLAIYITCNILYWISLWFFRDAFRHKLHLPGDCCTDCLTTLFCSCCVVAQMRTHVKRSEMQSGVDILPAYREV